MNYSTKTSAIHAITALINANGPTYPAKHPNELLDALVQELGDDPLVGALYYSCLCGIFREAAKKSTNLESLTALIQTRCAFKKAYAGELADVLMAVYSADNLTRLKKAKNAAFEDLCGLEDWPFVWDGEAEWTCRDGFVGCNGHGEAMLRVADRKKLLTVLQKALLNFAYCSLEEIQEAIAKQLCADLDGEFEEFCEDDDYYEPVVEDYDFEYDMKQICPRYGLEAFDITYEGSDEGFEPYCGKGRW